MKINKQHFSVEGQGTTPPPSRTGRRRALLKRKITGILTLLRKFISLLLSPIYQLPITPIDTALLGVASRLLLIDIT